MEARTIRFKDDGVYLDDERLSYIVELNLDYEVEGYSLLYVKDVVTDDEGYGITYEIHETVRVPGLHYKLQG